MDVPPPSQGVHDQLLPHVHLISTHRYPSLQRVEPQRVTEWLLAAPKISRDVAPFSWTYLDTPPDGFIFCAWQPLQRLGTEFASDGYIWSGPEVAYCQDVGNGLMLETYHQKAGFKPMVEPYTMHSRRRYRLVPGKLANPNMPPHQIDPSLFIIHYGPSDPQDHIPANAIQVDARTHSIMNFRMQLQRAGQIVRKSFMLNDRANYPQIPLPRMYPDPHSVQRPPVPQNVAYPPGPPSKRVARGHAPPHQPQHAQQQHAQQHVMGGPGGASLLEYEDDEDTSRGDVFDHVTPRDISVARYTQNHEWMEEVFASPYRMSQIMLPDLGLGLKGELAPLTQGIFEAQGERAEKEPPKKPYVGRLDKDLADEFRKRVDERIEATQAEMRRMEEEHAKTLAEIEKGRLFTRAERDLRGPSESASEFWRLEGRLDGSEDGGHASGGRKDPDEVAANVEAAVGRKPVEVQDVRRVQAGGYQEPVVEPPRVEPVSQPLLDPLLADPATAASSMSRHPSHAGSQNSGVMVGDSDIDMGGTAAGLLDQMHTGFASSTSTPVNNFPTPQPHLPAGHSGAGTPQASAQVASPHPPPTAQQHQQYQQQPQNPGAASQDVNMTNAPLANTAGKETTPPTAPDQGTGSGEWVVVPKTTGADIPPSAAGVPANTLLAGPGAATGGETVPGTHLQPQVSLPGAQLAGGPTQSLGASKPGSATGTPDNFSSLGDIVEGGGDALASFGETPGVGDDLDLNMDMEDSAFGDAFHGVSESRTGEGAGGDGTPSAADGGL